MTKQAFLFLFSLVITGSTFAGGFDNPAKALLDFEIKFELPKGSPEVNFLALSVCSREVINIKLEVPFVDGRPALDPVLDYLSRSHYPSIAGCEQLQSKFTYPSRHVDKTIGFTALEFYKSAIKKNIAIDDAVLVLSSWRIKNDFYFGNYQFNDYTDTYYVGHHVMDLLSIPVERVNEKVDPASIKLNGFASEVKVLAKTIQPDGNAPKNIN